MIVQPENMNFSKKTFSAIIYGPPGIGKTTLALSAPRPVLIDIDSFGISRVDAQYRFPTIVADTYEDIRNDLTKENMSQFDTIVIDTGGSLITYLKDWAMRVKGAVDKRGEFNSLKGFGFVKTEVSSFVEYITKILNKNVIFVFHSQEKADKDGSVVQRIVCEGSFQNTVWTPCDFGGFVQSINGKRIISFDPTQEFFAKGTQGVKGQFVIPDLDGTRKNDFMTRLFESARRKIAQDAAYYEEERKKYEEVMKQVHVVVDGISDPTSANDAVTYIQAMDHVLTSKTEASSLLMSKAREIGLKYTKNGFSPIQEDHA